MPSFSLRSVSTSFSSSATKSAFLFAAVLCPQMQSQVFAQTFLVQDVRVFDGKKMQLNKNVLIKDGKIIDLQYQGQISKETSVIFGKGRTLMPGMIDAHVHAYQDLDLPLLFGVTTQIDMFTDVNNVKSYNEKMLLGKQYEVADIYTAGMLATAPGGHGTQFPIKVETLTKSDQAQAWVDARIAEGSNFIKIVMEHGHDDQKTNSLDLDTVKALIKASHLRKKLAVVHISTYEDALAALDEGADGLVHLFLGKKLSDDELNNLVKSAKKNHAFVIPTVSVLESVAGTPNEKLTSDVRIQYLLNPTQLQTLKSRMGNIDNQHLFDAPQQISLAFHQANLPVLSGSDAGNAGTQYGASMHHEIAFLVQSGLSPIAALTSATSAPADVFKMKDRGFIAKGFKADLVLVEGAPDQRIEDTRNIVEVWKNGQLVTNLRVKKMAEVKEQNAQKDKAIDLPSDGRISLFSTEKLASPFGFGWLESNDGQMGGKSTTTLKVQGQSPSGQAAVTINASIKAGFAYPWSGISFFPGKAPMQAVDLSLAKTLKFYVKGDGKRYTASFFMQGSFIPVGVIFTAPKEWTEISFPLSQFKGLNTGMITMLSFNAGPEVGDYVFELADIRLLKQ
jgi:imidazolonepropionase-like amidohydrolase